MAESDDRDNEMIASSMRIPKRLRDELTWLAKEHKRSFNAELMWALERYVEQEGGGHRGRSGAQRRR